MLKVLVSTIRDKTSDEWLSLPSSMKERLTVFNKLAPNAENGTTVPICITDVQSSVPNLKRYIHEHDSLEQLNILGARIEKMSDRDEVIFSGALDMEAVNGLDDVVRIENSLGNYELFPDVKTPKELGVYLVESGDVEIPESAWPYLDYERVAAEYESNNAGVYTNLGYVVKTCDNTEQNIAGEKQTIKFFSPLTITAYPALAEKVSSLHPTIEEWDGELWGVMVAEVHGELTEAETDMMISYCTGQNSDGYGESFEQRPIKTRDGEIYVSFWNSENYFLKPEQELKQNSEPDLGCNTQTMGGM